MKILYRDPSGYTSTAYLDYPLDNPLENAGDTEVWKGREYQGSDKYTDLPVTVRWDGRRWVTSGCIHDWQVTNVYDESWWCTKCDIKVRC